MDKIGMAYIFRPRCPETGPECENRCGLYTIGKITTKGAFGEIRPAGDRGTPVGKYLLKVQDITPGKIEPITKEPTSKVFNNEIAILKKINFGPRMVNHWKCSAFGKQYGYILLENWCYGYEKCDTLEKFQKVLTGDGWRPDLAIKYINRMLREYKKLHDLGIAHIDNNIRNILYRKKPNQKAEFAIIDFGLSKDLAGKSDPEKANDIFLDIAGIIRMFKTFGLQTDPDRTYIIVQDEDLMNKIKLHMSHYMTSAQNKFELEEVFNKVIPIPEHEPKSRQGKWKVERQAVVNAVKESKGNVPKTV